MYHELVKKTIIQYYIPNFLNVYPSDILLERLNRILTTKTNTIDRLAKYVKNEVENRLRKHNINKALDSIAMYAIILDIYLDKPEDC